MAPQLLSSLGIVVELAVLGLAVLAFLILVGFGVTELLLPAAGRQVLLAPVVGLSVLMLGFQWMSFVVPPVVAAVLVFAVAAPFSVAVGWRRRSQLLTAWRDVAGAAAVGAAFYVALLLIMISRGAVTLASFPADNIFIYAQAAQYLRGHPMPSIFHMGDVSNPGSFYLSTVGTSFPNSVGALDAAVSILTGQPVYAVFDPLNALALALAIGAAWYFVRANLGGSWLTAAAAGMLIATSQLLYWVMGIGLQQECLALPIMVAGLGVFASSLRSGSSGAGVLVGILAASLAGLYLPTAVLLVIGSIAGAAVWLIGAPRERWRAMVNVFAAMIPTGLIASLAALYVLVFEGGLKLWLTVVGAHVAAGGISRVPALPYLLGTLPFAHVWELKPMPLGRAESSLWLGILASSGLLVLLLVVGVARAALRQRDVEAAIFIGGMLFVAYEAGVAHYPYGFVKTIGYMAPLTSSFVALGASDAADLIPASGRKVARIVAWCAALLVLLASVNATRDMLHLWLDSRPALTAADLRTANVASVVPVGATVLVDQPGTDYGTLIRAAAIAYFLPDRTVRVFVGNTRLGTFQNQDVHPRPCAFDYVIAAQSPGADFTQVYLDTGIQLGVYKREGPACAAT